MILIKCDRSYKEILVCTIFKEIELLQFIFHLVEKHLLLTVKKQEISFADRCCDHYEKCHWSKMQMFGKLIFHETYSDKNVKITA